MFYKLKREKKINIPNFQIIKLTQPQNEIRFGKKNKVMKRLNYPVRSMMKFKFNIFVRRKREERQVSISNPKV